MPLDLPIAFVAEDVAAIRAGRVTQVRRPGVLLRQAQPGDRLWVREPFHLAAGYDHMAPTDALAAGARVLAWSGDFPLPPDLNRGRRRFAREMPRAIHRMHLVVTAVRRERLRAVTEDDARREGAADRDTFARRWDQRQAGGRTISGNAARWADDPLTVVLAFDAIRGPIA